MLFSCERISKGLRVRDFNSERGGVTGWEVFLAGIELLEREENKHKVKCVCIDTLDAAHTMCMEYVCNLKGIEHPSDASWGKGWSALRQEFSTALSRIQRAGYGLIMISHSKEVTIKSHSGAEYTRIQPTASGSAYEIAKAITDMTLYTEWLRLKSGENVRVIITEGDEVVDAKNNIELPRYLPLKKHNGYAVLEDAFRGKKVGLDIANLMIANTTPKPVRELLRTQKKGN